MPRSNRKKIIDHFEKSFDSAAACAGIDTGEWTLEGPPEGQAGPWEILDGDGVVVMDLGSDSGKAVSVMTGVLFGLVTAGGTSPADWSDNSNPIRGLNA